MGVALTKCYFCGDGDRIIMNRVLTTSLAAKVESMNGKVIDMEPCNKCRHFMSLGVIFLTIDPEKSEPNWNKPPASLRFEEKRQWFPNPYRTGGFFVVKDEAVKKMLPEELATYALKERYMFIEEGVARDLGFYDMKPTMTPEEAAGKRGK